MKQQTEERLAWVWLAAWVILLCQDTATTEIYSLPLHGALPIALGRDSLKRAQRLQGHLERCLAATLDSETD